MLTKTKKWLSFFVLAIVAVLLVGCTKEKEEVPVNPTAIEISKDVFVQDGGVMVGGDAMLLSIITTPENAIKTVTWSSSDATIATVNAQGEVHGLKGGKVTIKAISTVDQTIMDEVEVFVYEDINKNRVLVNAMNEIKEKMPEFVDDDFQFPTPTNTLVKAEYYDVNGNRHANNVYVYAYVFDAMETVNVKLSYEGETLEFSDMFNVVEDPEHNEFTAIAEASAELNEFMADLKANKVKENVVLPFEYTIGEGEEAMLVKVTYTSSNVNVFKVNTTEATETTEKVVLGAFNRPNDDTPFTLEAYLTVEYVSNVQRHNLVANGYSVAEKVAYITENTLPSVTEVEGANVNLPARDAKFAATISWETSNADVMTAAGKMNPFLATASEVKLTATITYLGTLSSAFAFTEEVELTINVKPAANDAQRIVLDLGNRIEADEEFPFYFPWGAKDRENNILPLPTTVGGDSQFKDLAVTWTASEAGLFSETWELQKQYLRYHEVKLTFAVTSGSDTATGEIVINVGVAKMANTVYIGGRFTSTNMGASAPTDGVHTISKADKGPDGNVATAWTYGTFNGITFYVDVTDENGVVTRYQYFASNRYTWEFNENVPGGVVVDEDGKMSLFEAGNTVKSALNEINPNYQYMLLVNNTEKDILVPITYLNYKGSTVKQDVNGTTLIRQTSLAFDGWRVAFAADKDGKVTFGYGNIGIETAMTEAAEKDEEGNFTLPEYVTIPAGGVGYSPFTTQNNAAIMGLFSVVDTNITFERLNVQ